MVPTRAERYSYVLCSTQSRERTWEPWMQWTIAQWHGTSNVLTELLERTEMDAALEKMLYPTTRSPATGKSVAGIINLL